MTAIVATVNKISKIVYTMVKTSKNMMNIWWKSTNLFCCRERSIVCKKSCRNCKTNWILLHSRSLRIHSMPWKVGCSNPTFLSIHLQSIISFNCQIFR
jgi:hypothetical protein